MDKDREKGYWTMEHNRLHHTIEELERCKYLSPEDELDLKILKKRKLYAKDRMVNG